MDFIQSRYEAQETKLNLIVQRLSNWFNLPYLPNHFNYLMISLLGCFILQFLSQFYISPYFFPIYYSKLSSFTKFNWDTRLVAWFHSFYATSIGLFVLINPTQFQSIHDDKLFGYHPQAMNFLAISAGYFLWDILVSLVMSIKGHGVGFLLHAISCFLAFFYSIKPFGGYFGFVFLLWEASTIFLNPHWFFDKIGMSGSKAQIYNGIALLISFFFSRLVLGNYTSYQLFVLCFQPGVSEKAGKRLLNTILFLDILLSGLNVYWFYQMIASVRKRIALPSSLNKSKTKKNN